MTTRSVPGAQKGEPRAVKHSEADLTNVVARASVSAHRAAAKYKLRGLKLGEK